MVSTGWPWGGLLVLWVVITANQASARQEAGLLGHTSDESSLLLGEQPRLLGGGRSMTVALPLASSVNSSRFQPPFNICTSEWAPMITCGETQDGFTGYQIELFRLIAKDLGWAPDEWTFTCMDWTAMIDDLVDPHGGCTLAAAGVEVSLENLGMGIKFSWPIYKNGLQVLIAAQVEHSSIWAFGKAFHWSVWALLAGTAVIVALLVHLIESIAYSYEPLQQRQEHKMGLNNWLWYSSSMLVHVGSHVGDPKTWSARLLILAYGFLALIMLHLYTATSASNFTQKRLSNTITSKADLPGKPVETWEPYVGILRKYGIDAKGMVWDNDEDMDIILSKLRSGQFKAMVMDTPVMQFMAGSNEHCDLFVVGDSFETFFLGLAFPPEADDSTVSIFSTSLVKLQTQQGAMDMLENKYIKVADAAASCVHGPNSHQGHEGQIVLKQVAGLWVVLVIMLGGSVMLASVTCFSKRPETQRGLERMRSSLQLRSSLDIAAPPGCIQCGLRPAQQPQ